jgi:hypothetical protein
LSPVGQWLRLLLFSLTTPCMSLMMTMTDLSPAADAVLDAYMNNCGWLDGPLEKDYRCAAAVLRAAATAIGAQELFHPDSKRTEGVKWCVQNIYAIADELEAHQ